MLRYVSLCFLGLCWSTTIEKITDLKPRIVNGDPATHSEYPYIVSLKYGSDDWISGHFCGGSIITDPYGDYPIILTAAHCVDDVEDSIAEFEESVFAFSGETITGGLYVDVGRTNIKSEFYKGQKQVYDSIKVLFVVPHPEYDSEATENDIAVLKLSRPIDSSKVDAAMITWDEDPDLELGEWLQVSGYGTNQSNGSFSATLEFANQSYIDTDTCDKYFYLYSYGGNSSNNSYTNTIDWSDPDFSNIPSQATSGFIFEDMICGGAVSKDSCQGDSGGPFIRPGSRNDGSNDLLVGVVSWGIGCAAGTPGVYAYVNYFRNWINSCIDVAGGDFDLWDDCTGGKEPAPGSSDAVRFNSYVALFIIFVVYSIFG